MSQPIEPWDLRPDDTRQADTVWLFIVFCEDGAVEPAYVRRFGNARVRVSALEDFGQHHRHVDRATDWLRADHRLETIDGLEYLKPAAGVQVWCLFDRDKSPGDGKDTSFNDSIRNAEDKGLKVAWSNDDFELWILLHFEDVDAEDPAMAHRQGYYARLTQLLPDIARAAGLPGELLRPMDSPHFSYYAAMKTQRRFVQITLPCLAGRLDTAMQRALALEARHSAPDRRPSDKAPCTRVHTLIQAILSVGGSPY